MVQVAQGGERLHHDAVSGRPGQVGHEGDPARVVLVPPVVQPLRLGAVRLNGAGVRGHGPPLVVGSPARHRPPRDDVGPGRWAEDTRRTGCGTPRTARRTPASPGSAEGRAHRAPDRVGQRRGGAAEHELADAAVPPATPGDAWSRGPRRRTAHRATARPRAAGSPRRAGTAAPARSAPTAKARNDDTAARVGEARSSASTPNSSRACTRTALSEVVVHLGRHLGRQLGGQPLGDVHRRQLGHLRVLVGRDLGPLDLDLRLRRTPTGWRPRCTPRLPSRTPPPRARPDRRARRRPARRRGADVPPTTPAISAKFDTSPSIAPNTAGRSHPPVTSGCSCWTSSAPGRSSGSGPRSGGRVRPAHVRLSLHRRPPARRAPARGRGRRCSSRPGRRRPTTTK